MATAKLYFDTRREKTDGTYPVKIEIIHEREQRYFRTAYSYSKTEFKKIESDFRLTEAQRKDKLRIEALINKANEIIEDLNPFSFDAFTLRFTSKGNRKDLIYLLKQKAEADAKTGGIGNSNLYLQASGLLEKYLTDTTKESELKVGTVTPEWLKKFEVWVLNQVQKNGSPKYSMTTINMYLIRVRAIFNDIIDKGELNRSSYPFHRADNKKGYKIPPANNNKRALTIEEVLLIYNYKTIRGAEIFARDMFIFSYLASGMNMVDIFNLKWSDIEDGKFSFVRKKTEKKTRGANKILITVTDELNNIINTHGSHKLNNDYIFNVLNKNMTAKEITNETKRVITLINTNLKRIAKSLGITEKISTYFARHSYSTALMNNNVSIALISKHLGHADIKTTQSYLGSFDTKKADEYHRVLLGQPLKK